MTPDQQLPPLPLAEDPIQQYNENKARFMRTCTTLVNEVKPGWLEAHRDQPFTMLSVAAGSQTEIDIVGREFPQANLYAIDMSKEAADMSTILSRRFPDRYHFNQGDARLAETYHDENGNAIQADLVFLRSPDAVVPSLTEKWKTIIPQAWEHVREGGVFYLTTNDKADIEATERILVDSNIPFERIENPEPLQGASAFPENIIFVALKPSPSEE